MGQQKRKNQQIRQVACKSKPFDEKIMDISIYNKYLGEVKKSLVPISLVVWFSIETFLPLFRFFNYLSDRFPFFSFFPFFCSLRYRNHMFSHLNNQFYSPILYNIHDVFRLFFFILYKFYANLAYFRSFFFNIVSFSENVSIFFNLRIASGNMVQSVCIKTL